MYAEPRLDIKARLAALGRSIKDLSQACRYDYLRLTKGLSGYLLLSPEQMGSIIRQLEAWEIAAKGQGGEGVVN